MENNKLDNLFRSSLEEHEIQPPEKSWSGIQADLKKKRPAGKKWRGLWFLTAALILPFLGYIAYQQIGGEPDVAPTSAQQENAKTESDVIASTDHIISNPAPEISKSTVEEVIPSASSENPAVNSQVEAKAAASSSSEIVSTGENIPTNYSPAIIRENPVAVKRDIQPEMEVTPAPSEPMQRQEEMVSTASTENTSEQAPEVLSEVTSEPVIAKGDPSPEIAQPDASQVRETFMFSEPAIAMEENEGTQRKQDAANTPAAPPNELKNDISKESAGSNEQAAIQSEEKPPVKENAEAPSAPATVTDHSLNHLKPAGQDSSDYAQQSNERKSFFKIMLSHLSADIYFSPDYAKSRLESNTEYTGTASTNINDYNNEKAKFSFSTGFHIRYDLGKKFSVGSGISYSTFDQTAVYNTISVVADSVYQETHGRRPHGQGGGPGNPPGHGHGGHQGNNPHTPPGGGNHHFIIHTPCGAIDLYNEPPHGNASVQDGDTLQIKTETSETTRFIYIPLVFQYRFGNKKLSYFVEAGGAVNLVRSNKVKVVVNDAYVENNEHDGLKTSNYSLIFGAGVNYNFYKGLSMFLKPSIRYSITPINQNNPVNSYPYYMGVGAGLSIHF